MPARKARQAFTPKRILRKIVDLLEEENPGFFGGQEKTLAGLFMGSGFNIVENVKRL